MGFRTISVILIKEPYAASHCLRTLYNIRWYTFSHGFIPRLHPLVINLNFISCKDNEILLISQDFE